MLGSNEQAYVRGQKAATFWKRLKKVVSTWDQLCVGWAKNHKLPAWIGHVPIACLVAVSAVSCLAGGLLLTIGVLFVWAFLLLPSVMELLRPTVNVKVTNWEEKSHNSNYGSNGSNGSDGSTGS
uniref:hypothetical protein n=1 Tax=Scandinavium goeteborgense TaxID=1851514 RepID=UPI00135A1195|nr:hypothetical protein [Scandinavium goeteborgense]